MNHSYDLHDFAEKKGLQPDKIQGGTVTVCIQFFQFHFFDFSVAGLAFDPSNALCATRASVQPLPINRSSIRRRSPTCL